MLTKNQTRDVERVESSLIQTILDLRLLFGVGARELRVAKFLDLGLDSLTAAHLREIIAEEFHCEIPEALVGLELDTVRKCAEYIVKNSTLSGRETD